MRKTVILVPAFNEEASIEVLLKKVAAEAETQGWDYRIIVADDASYDATPSILARLSETLPLEVITHKINRGLGETSRDLFERAAELTDNGDVVIRMDGDDTHEPHYMKALVDKLDEGYDVVIASRFQRGGGQQGLTPYRALVSRAANVFMSVVFPIPGVREYSCGYRAYRADIVRRAIAFYGNNFIQLKGLGFTATLEKLIKLDLLGARFAELPFTLRYDQKRSPSKMVTSVTTLGYGVMAIVHYWPWGGWRRGYSKLLHERDGHGRPQ